MPRTVRLCDLPVSPPTPHLHCHSLPAAPTSLLFLGHVWHAPTSVLLHVPFPLLEHPSVGVSRWLSSLSPSGCCFQALHDHPHLKISACPTLPGSASGKEPTCQCRRHKRCGFDPWARKIPWRRTWQPTPVFLPGESHGQMSLAGYSP